MNKKEIKETLSKVLEYKDTCEANIVSIFWKNPALLIEYEDITIHDFSKNHWKVYFEIANGIIRVENKQTLDEITVGAYLEKHKKLYDKFIEYGGFDTVQKLKEYVQEDNILGYIKELRKWQRVLLLAKNGFPIVNRLSDFADMSVDDIYDEYEANLNNIFSSVNFDVKSYSIADGIYEQIEKWDQGDAIGLPFYNMPILTRELGGLHLGDITLVGGISNAGKSSFIRLAIIPSIIKKDKEGNSEKIVVFLNEEGIAKWQREMIVWVANNIYGEDIEKWRVRNGSYDKELKELLYKCADYLSKLKEDHTFTLVPLESYTTDIVIKQIKKFSALGVKYFVIDTFKADNGNDAKINNNTRLEMVQNITKLYNIIKDSVKNVCLVCTVQLTKATSKIRYLTQDALSESKNIINPCASGLFIRNMYDDEQVGDRALKVYKNAGMNGKSITVVQLDPNKKYQILFIVKGRESAAGIGSRQLVYEVDHSKNIIKEMGWTYVPVDF